MSILSKNTKPAAIAASGDAAAAGIHLANGAVQDGQRFIRPWRQYSDSRDRWQIESDASCGCGPVE